MNFVHYVYPRTADSPLSDLYVSRTSQPPFSRRQSAWKTLSTVEDSVRSLRAEVGSCPRDLVLKVADPTLYEAQIQDAFRDYSTLDKIIPLVGQTFMNAPAGFSNKHSHIILVQRVGPVLEDSYGNDSSFVTLKTMRIRQYVMDIFFSLDLREAKKLFGACLGISPRGAVFAGHVFEGLAVWYTLEKTSGVQMLSARSHR